MYLREVVINGFKSFADRTRLRLDRGVTAIVGPNGCGKSNIVDCIRWVLGEQSAKALRGGRMQDVIFEGTDKRKPLQMCEVSLIFAECEDELGTQFNEVEITRRVTRDGGSDYFLNGKGCRLKDIQRLFMDTGVGRVSYSFMVQGQIDQILSSNPAERRTIFEEAAGITRYKSQRKEALNKLALVEQNLSRVTDVIEELSRQIGSLKRQAGKALRYKRFRHRLTHLDLAWNAHQYQERFGKFGEYEDKAKTLRASVESLQSALGEKEAALEHTRAERNEHAGTLQEAQQSVFDLRSEKEAAESRSEFALIRAKDLRERIERLSRELKEFDEQLAALSDRERDRAENKRAQMEMVGSSDAVFQEKSTAVRETEETLAKADRELQQLRQDLLVVEGSVTRLRQQCTTSEVDLKSYQVKHAEVSDRRHELNSERGTIEQRLQETRDAREARQNEASEAEEAARQAQERVGEARARFRDLQGQISEADRELARKSARLATLEDLQRRFEGFSEGAKAILQGKLDDIIAKGSYYALGRYLEVEEGYGDMLELLLGTAAEAIVIDEFERAAPLAEALRERQAGRACIQVPMTGAPAPDQPAGALPEGITAAGAVVRAREEKLAPLLRQFLNGCYFAEDLESFLDYIRANPGFDFYQCVTRAGEVIDWRGLVFAGPRKGAGKESSFIQREKQIRELTSQVEADNARLTGLYEQADKEQAALAGAEQALETARARSEECRSEVATLRAEERGFDENLSQNAQAIERCDKQLAEMDESRSRAEQRVSEAQRKLEEAEQQIREKRQAIDIHEKEVARLREERDRGREGLAEVRLDLAEKRQRLELLDRGLSEIGEQRGEIEAQKLRRNQELDTMRQEAARLEEESGEQAGKARELARTLEVTMETLRTARQKHSAAEEAIRKAEEGLAEERSRLRNEESSLNALEVKLAEERSQAAFMQEKVESEYQRNVAEIDWKQELWRANEEFETRVKLDELEDDSELTPRRKRERGEPSEEDLASMDQTSWPEISTEIRNLRERISALGEVNPNAIEEYAELKERYDFLKSQSDDLWNSKNELLKAIDEINRTSQELFQQTFEQVRKNFVFTFEKLFGGGQADLALIEAEDILESGIEITARPPGTKLKSLSLLSGGQKTMTAVALLFAIYMVKPSPFCVLDELDAPLDDANIGRFTDMLRQFTRYSQFLVITHSKRTIASADTLYGVTMEERGVTRMISMRFDRERGQTEQLDPVTAGA